MKRLIPTSNAPFAKPGWLLMAGAFFLLIASCGESKKPVAEMQHLPFYQDIQKFKRQDSASFPPAHAILFIGSSSFTKWTDMQKYFPDYPVINRGFGGSTLPDVINFVKDIVYPYKPREIVIYCGENDLASSDTVTGKTVFDRFVKLYGLIRKKYADIPVVYVSMKPSPSRRKLFARMREGNQLIRDFLAAQNTAGKMESLRTGYVDVHSLMLNAAGQPFPEIFLSDSLHMNAKGYAIWQKAIEPYLIK